MLPFLHSSKIRTIAVVLVLAVISIGMWYWLHPSASTENPPLLPRDAKVVKQDNNIKITSGTDILQRIVYTKCNDEETFRTKPADNLAGLSYQQFQKVYPGWSIVKFDTTEIEMTLKVDSYCREHANNMFIGIKDGYVAIYQGKPGNKPVLKEVTKIPVSRLMNEDADELRRGMVVQSREELLRFIEGLDSR